MADDETTTTEDDATSTTEETADEALGDAGKAALKAERTRAAAAERQAKALQKQLDEIVAANATEGEKAIAKAKDEGRAEVLSTVNERVLRAEVKAVAGGKLADPADAVKLLDLSQFTVGDDGNVDTKAISTAIDELVKEKPYLAPAGARPTPLPGGGARPSGGNSIDQQIRRAAGQ